MWGQPPSAVRRAQRGRDVEDNFAEQDVEERRFSAASTEQNEVGL